MAGYIGSKASVVSSGAERKKTFTITGATTSLTGLNYTVGKVHVFQNGVRLVDGTDYTATNSTTITLTVAAQSGDNVVVISQASYQVALSGIDDQSNAVAMTIDSNENIGIGTSSPDSTLTVKGASHTNFQVKSNSESTKAFIQTVQDSDVRIGSSTNHPVSFYQNGIERLRIDSSGRVGIGAVPTAQFAHNILQVGSQATLGANATLSTTGQTYLTHNLYYNTDGNFRVFNTSGANEGSIYQQFDGNHAWSNSASTTGNPTVTERMRIDSSGNVTTPSQPNVRLNLAGHFGINNSAPNYPGVQVDNFSVKENVGSHWNNTNNNFTCPVTGVYCISVFYIKYPAAGAAHVDIHLNGVASSIDVRWRASEGTSSYEQAGGTIFVSCAANDILDWHYFGAPGIHSGNGQWSIRLVG
jgi:hypothetical protein